MKKIFLPLLLSLVGLNALAWGGIGHQTVVVIAERHISQTTRENIKALISYPLRNDASWMDKHRRDPEYAFTGSYHTMAMNENYVYDPSWRLATGGDCVTGLQFLEYNLTHQDKLALTDSVKVLDLRLLIHIVGDMHCPCHSYAMPKRNQWKCTYKGEQYKYHGFIDHIPDLMFEGMTIDEIAESIDKASRKQIRKWQKGSFIDWAQDCCTRDKAIYDVNPYGTYELDPQTEDKLRPCVEEALCVAGYRLAYLLDRYFGN